jgi:hypothetical protein
VTLGFTRKDIRFTGVTPSVWYTLAAHRWYTLADYAWYTLAEHRWYIIARSMTNSNRNYNVLFKDESGKAAEAQITAFDDTWHWSGSPPATVILGVDTN